MSAETDTRVEGLVELGARADNLVQRLRAYSEASDVVLVCEEAADALAASQAREAAKVNDLRMLLARHRDEERKLANLNLSDSRYMYGCQAARADGVQLALQLIEANLSDGARDVLAVIEAARKMTTHYLGCAVLRKRASRYGDKPGPCSCGAQALRDALTALDRRRS